MTTTCAFKNAFAEHTSPCYPCKCVRKMGRALLTAIDSTPHRFIFGSTPRQHVTCDLQVIADFQVGAGTETTEHAFHNLKLRTLKHNVETAPKPEG